MVTDEQITLYAIGALDAREAAEFERQIAASAELRKRVAEEKAAAASLLVYAKPVAPPPALKAKLMARIGSDIASTPKVEPKQQTRAGLGDIWRYLLGGLSAGFAALALVLGVGLLNSQSQLAAIQSQANVAKTELQSTSERAAQLERDLVQARADLEQTQAAVVMADARANKSAIDTTAAQIRADAATTQLASVQREISVLNQTDIRTAALPSNKAGFESGNIRVFYSPDGKTALFIVSNLPKLSADKDYQVWLIKDTLPLPSSVFDTDDAGTGRFIVESAEPFAAFQNLGVTIEPAGGRPTPNPEGPIYLGPLS